jgi:hypothetical protein
MKKTCDSVIELLARDPSMVFAVYLGDLSFDINSGDIFVQNLKEKPRCSEHKLV